jgi:uncharacterized protein YqgV (UPF0045/DUF77 family)
MQMTAELSLYPLAGDVNDNVLAFIEDLVTTGKVSVVTTAMSTQISGDYDAVFEAVKLTLRQSYERAGRQVLVAKFLPGFRQEIGPEVD